MIKKLKVRTVRLLYNVLFLFGVLSILSLVTWLSDKPIQAITTLIAWTVLFYFMDKMLHFWDSLICFVVTSYILSSIIIFSLPIEYSLFSAVLLVALSLYILSVLRDRNDIRLLSKKLELQLADTNNTAKIDASFDLQSCTVEELNARVKEKYPDVFGKDLEYLQERARLHFIEALPHKDLSCSEEASRQERRRLRAKLK